MPCWRSATLVASLVTCVVGCKPEAPGPATPTEPARLDADAIAQMRASLVGRWSGALMDDRGSLGIEIDVTRGSDGTLWAEPSVPDWLGYPPAEQVPLTVDEQGISIAHLVYGPATLQMDLRFRQLVGEVESSHGSIAVHLRQGLPTPHPRTASEVVRVAGHGVELEGTLWLPDGEGPHPAMLVIGGRGCYARSQSLGRVLPAYGLAVLSYDKRGTGSSSGDCATATFDDLVHDAGSMVRALRSHPRIDATAVGLWGGSAGAWTAQGLVAQMLDDTASPPAFVVTWVGPGTSIAQQQRDSSVAIAQSLGLSDAQTALASEVLEISLDRSVPRAEAFERLRALESEIRAQGWLERMFEDTDFPETEAGVDLLWVRRFSFDPAPTLARMSHVPYLAVLGEEDDVVPYEINAKALRDASGGRIEVVGIPGVGHGFEHGDQRSTLTDGTTYFKFDTVEPQFFTATIAFLRGVGVLPR